MILLVDINSYFATMLQQENPHLRGKPVVIVKDLGRTCIIAASKEAKKLGIKTGTNLYQAKKLAPNLIELKAEFDLYLSATRQLNKLFKSIAPQVKIFSLDEAFIDISDCAKYLYPDSTKLGQQIQTKIKQTLGEWVTCNVGLGSNYLLAKMAAEISPKGRVFAINQKNKDAVLASVKFTDVCGIGLRLSQKLAKLGIEHPYQIRFFTDKDFLPIFGPFWTKELFKIAYGQEPHHFVLFKNQTKPQPAQTTSRSITMWQLIDDENQIKQILYNLTKEVIYKIRDRGLAGRRVIVHLSGSDQVGSHLSWHDQITLKTPINHTLTMFDLVYHRLYQKWQRQFRPIKFAVSLGLLQPVANLTTSLLPSWQKQEKIEQAVDQIWHKYGLFTVHSGLLLDSEIIKPEVTGFFADKQYQL